MKTALYALGPLALALAPACASPGPLAPGERAVAPAAHERVWTAATPEDLDGLYSSVEIEGPLAAVLREVHYWFASDGSFSAAALVVVPTPSFRTLEGRWSLADGRIELGEGAAPGTADVSDDFVRLSGDEGIVVLRRRTMP